MSVTWRAFMSPLQEERLEQTTKQDTSSLILSSRQSPQKIKQVSPKPASSELYAAQSMLENKSNSNLSVCHQMNDLSSPNLHQQILKNNSSSTFHTFTDISPKKSTLQLTQKFQQPFTNLDYPQSLDDQENIFFVPRHVNTRSASSSSSTASKFIPPQLSANQFHQINYPNMLSERSPISYYQSSDENKSKHQRISIIPNEFMQYASTTRSQSNQGSSNNKKNSYYLDQCEHQQRIESFDKYCQEQAQNQKPMPINENKQNLSERETETEMLKKCMMKIQMKLDKEKQKRRELKQMIQLSNQSIGTLRSDIDSYQLDIQLVKQLTINTSRTIMETCANPSGRNQSVEKQRIAPKRQSCYTQTALKRNKEQTFHQSTAASKQRSVDYPSSRNKKAINSMFIDLSGVLHSFNSSSSEDESMFEKKPLSIHNHSNQQGIQKNASMFNLNQTESEVRLKSRLRQDVNQQIYSNEIRKIQESKKEKASYYLSKLDKGSKLDFSGNSSNSSVLKFLQTSTPQASSSSLNKQKKKISSSKPNLTLLNSTKNHSEHYFPIAKIASTTINQNSMALDDGVIKKASSSKNQAQKILFSSRDTSDALLKKIQEIKNVKKVITSEIRDFKKGQDQKKNPQSYLNFTRQLNNHQDSCNLNAYSNSLIDGQSNQDDLSPIISKKACDLLLQPLSPPQATISKSFVMNTALSTQQTALKSSSDLAVVANPSHSQIITSFSEQDTQKKKTLNSANNQPSNQIEQIENKRIGQFPEQSSKLINSNKIGENVHQQRSKVFVNQLNFIKMNESFQKHLSSQDSKLSVNNNSQRIGEVPLKAVIAENSSKSFQNLMEIIKNQQKENGSISSSKVASAKGQPITAGISAVPISKMIGSQKGIDQYKKQLFPEGVDFSEDECNENNPQNYSQEMTANYIPSTTITAESINENSSNDSGTFQGRESSQLSKLTAFSPSQLGFIRFPSQVMTQARSLENNNEEILLKFQKQQQIEPNMMQSGNQNQVQLSQSSLFYKTSAINNKKSNVTGLQNEVQLYQAEIKATPISQTQEKDELNLSSDFFTERTLNKSGKKEFAQEFSDSPMIPFKSNDSTKNSLKKKNVSSSKFIPKSPLQLPTLSSDPINFSNVSGGISSRHSESLAYTASIGTTPGKSNFFSTPIQNPISSNAASINFHSQQSQVFPNLLNSSANQQIFNDDCLTPQKKQ